MAERDRSELPRRGRRGPPERDDRDAEREGATCALLDLIVATASGQPTCAERNDERELAIWKTGVTL
jgi:hypothetical protein